MIIKRVICFFTSLVVTVGIMAQPQPEEVGYDLSYFLPKGSYTYNERVPVPADVLGFQLGAQHAEWSQVVNYMHALAATTDRVTVQEMGRTYQHRPIIQVTITSSENQKRMDQLKSEHLKLSDVTQSGSLDLKKMPAVVSLVYSVHGNEPSGVNASLAVAYFLAAAQGERIDSILSNTVIVMSPGVNPDGVNRFASWVNSSRSLTNVSDLNSREFLEPWPSSRSNHYWADCNRDWLMAQHPEGIASLKTYFDWLPNVVADHHEQGPARPYYFSPGHPKRTHQLTSSENQAFTAEIATYCAEELDKIGTLYYSKEGYDDYYYGKAAAYGDIHGSVCMLYEQGTSRGHLRDTRNGVRSFAWTIRNQAYGSYATILAGYQMRDRLLAYQKTFYEKAASAARAETTKGYLFDARGSQATAYHFLENMAHHHINVYRLAKSMSVNGKEFKTTDAYVIPMEQKNSTMIRTLMENSLEYTDSVFYDISTWTFPHAFNLKYTTVKSVSGLLGELVKENKFPVGQVIGGKSEYGYVFESTEFYTPKVINELLKKGVHVSASHTPFLFQSGEVKKKMGYGTILVTTQNQPITSDDLFAELGRLSALCGVDVYAASTGLMAEVDLGSPAYSTLRLPKVAVLVGRSMGVSDSGEVWYLLDKRFQMRPTLIESSVLTTQKLQRYNVIVMANGVPDLSKTSEAALTQWVSDGGTLIATGKAYAWARKAGLITLKTKDASFKEDSTAYRAYDTKSDADAGNDISGVILNCHLDVSHPLAWGFNQSEIAVMKKGNTIFKKDADPYISPLYYTKKPLLSGFLSSKNEKLLKDTPAVFAKRQGDGAVIVFADDMNFRSYWLGTSKLFMNAIFFSECLKKTSYNY